MFIDDEEDKDIETTADNVEESKDEQPTPPVEQVDQTKAFAARLKEEKAKAKAEAKEEIAKSFGYDSWQAYADAQTNNKLLDNGLDPDSVRPVIKDLIKNDPEYIEAMRYKAEKEELEKELFATNSIQALNSKFGTTFKSINDLDEATVNMWNSGIPLETAFAANNYSLLIENAVKAASVPKDNGKSHLKTVAGSTEQTKVREPSKGELDVVKSMGYSVDQFTEFLKRTNKN